MIKVTGIIVCEVLVYTLLKQYKPEYAVISEALCGVILIFIIADEFETVINVFLSLFTETGVDGKYVSVLLKSLGIALITQFTADICRDAGESAAASKVEFAGRVIMTATAIPLIEGVLGLITEMAGGI